MEQPVDIDKREHQQESNTEVVVLPAQTSLINEVHQEIMEGISTLPPLPNQPRIFRVHEGLRHVNEKAYTPMLVSIGPYHHEKDNKFLAMEEHKKRYLGFLLKRVNENVDKYLEAMMELEPRARNCYASPVILERDKFVKMMLLDACFVVEFLRKQMIAQLRDKDDPIFQESWMESAICRDLVLLENQLPFFVLSRFYHMTNVDHEHPSFKSLAMVPICEMLLEVEYFSSDHFSTSESMHFLDLVHNLAIPSFIDSSPNESELSPKMPCVIELLEAGVKLKVKEGEVNMFDINFESGQLKIPKFQVSDSTETFLRNIIAYEQHSPDEERKYFTDYMCFMDMLINSKEDVNKLCGCNIIDNLLGDDDEVANIFNKLGAETTILSSFYYSELCKKVNAHCEKWINRVIANLRHNYFNNPWAGVSTVAATVLLLLTITQTVVSLIPLIA